MDRTCIYLRKSRADEEIEKTLGEGETLAKHRKALMKYAKEKQLSIVEIKEEIVSGDSLFHRPKMLELLKEVENNEYTGVLVMDIDRLGRGGMKDQGIILDAFKESNTKIITPTKTYDLNNDLDEEITEFKTFFSRRELKVINKRMQGGRIRSVEDGNYIATNPPLGYDIEYVNKNRILKINDSESKIIKIIFDRYINGDGAGTIASYLNSLGYKTKINKNFTASSVLFILKNPIYIGKITWKKKELKKSKSPNKVRDCKTRNKNEWIISEGKHDSIIDKNTFNRANELLQEKYHVPYRQNNPPVNPFAGILICGKCKHKMIMRKARGKKRIMCIHKCGNISMNFDKFEDLAFKSIKEFLKNYELKIETSITDNKKIDYSRELILLKKELTLLNSQKMNIFDSYERKIYSEEMFIERSNNISSRISSIQFEIDKLVDLIAEESLKEKSDNLLNFKNVILSYKNTEDIKLKNELLKSIIIKIELINTPDALVIDVYPRLLK
ncbi:recombinase family protein [Clostridium butyricum]|uniref:Site-specific recombinase n=1 Tax=Clostridium butyricum E4 str. BoNT E BL5262 TaxID=632245 RepID=C4IHJ3_CLOBU|nr:recombinase family protein [Clostridium butyricum]EEP53350.1 site-specific recombinase [Clostridium butyricum E4 str. BoNT E BL5262]NFL30588.1 recombinase family protein [Clostridium butyricum]NFS19542.1 recombinase family protein [Clostridium butyricum]